MVPYYGDYSEDQTVYLLFNTFDSNDPSASVTITNLADADIHVHKDGSATEIVTDGATVSLNFDSITGNHLVTIDTSVHADYATGSDYMVRMEGTTVDAATINAWIGTFSIENRHASVTANSILTDTAEIGAAGAGLTEAGGTGDQLTAINLPNQTMDIVGDITGNLSGSVGSVTGAVGSVTGAVGSVTAEVSADTVKISGSATAADNLEESTEAIIPGSAVTGTLSTTACTSDLSGYLDDELIGRTIIFKSGQADGQASDITDYAAASGLLTFTALATAPLNGDLFVIV